jgi:hypothetical protein
MGAQCAKSAKIAVIGDGNREEARQLLRLTEALGLTTIHITEMLGQFRRADIFKHNNLTLQELIIGYKFETEWLAKLLFQSVSLCLIKSGDTSITFVALVIAVWNLCTASRPVLAEMMFTFFHVAGREPKENRTLFQAMVYIGPNKLCRLEVDRMVEIEFGSHSLDSKHLKELLESLPHDTFGDIKKTDFLECALAHEALVLKPLIAFQRKVQNAILNPAVWSMATKHRQHAYPPDMKVWDILPDMFEEKIDEPEPVQLDEKAALDHLDDVEQQLNAPAALSSTPILSATTLTPRTIPNGVILHHGRKCATIVHHVDPQEILNNQVKGMPVPSPLQISNPTDGAGMNEVVTTPSNDNGRTPSSYAPGNAHKESECQTPQHEHIAPHQERHIASVDEFFKGHHVPRHGEHKEQSDQHEMEHHHNDRHRRHHDAGQPSQEGRDVAEEQGKHHHQHHQHHPHHHHHHPQRRGDQE